MERCEMIDMKFKISHYIKDNKRLIKYNLRKQGRYRIYSMIFVKMPTPYINGRLFDKSTQLYKEYKLLMYYHLVLTESEELLDTFLVSLDKEFALDKELNRCKKSIDEINKI